MPHIPLRYHVGVLCYCLSCVALHSLLQQHYVTQCTNTWLSAFSIEPSAYCTIVRKTLSILQASPLVVSSAVIAGAPLIE